MDWLMNNWGTLAVGLVVAAVVALIIINYVRKKKQGQSTCGCGCADCPSKSGCQKTKEEKMPSK